MAWCIYYKLVDTVRLRKILSLILQPSLQLSLQSDGDRMDGGKGDPVVGGIAVVRGIVEEYILAILYSVGQYFNL